LLIATVGVDSMYGAERFAFGLPFLQDGIEFLLVMVGAYGIGEVLTRLHAGFAGERKEDAPAGQRFKTALPRLAELLRVKGALARGTAAGMVVGVVPGAGATVSAFVAYGLESQYGKDRAALGAGSPAGIVVAKSAATASVGGALVPLLTMGIPGSGATAVMLAAFLLHGIQPGPQVFVSSTALVYTVFAAVFVAVIGMCILGYFAIRPLCKVLDAPEPIVSAFVVLFCFIGAFAARSNLSDVYVVAILGPLAENHFTTTMVSYSNDWTVFFRRPISGTIMAITIAGLCYPIVREAWRRWRARRTVLIPAAAAQRGAGGGGFTSTR
jgi:putative tricarboxylic transport membrane protein